MLTSIHCFEKGDLLHYQFLLKLNENIILRESYLMNISYLQVMSKHICGLEVIAM